MNRIELHIERVVLDGVPLAPGGERSFKEALANEMTRLLGETPTMSFRTMPSARASIVSDGNPERLGRHVAQGVHQSIHVPPGTSR